MISGLPESTLRYYEQIGIIAPIARNHEYQRIIARSQILVSLRL